MTPLFATILMMIVILFLTQSFVNLKKNMINL